MSFSSDVKRELALIECAEREKKLSELYGMLLFAGKFNSREIILKTENSNTAERFSSLLSELFNPILEKQSDLNPDSDKKNRYKLSVMLSDDCKRIYECFGHTSKDINLRINRANLDDESLYAPFLRGVFLSCGSVTDPAKGYHLELAVRRKVLAENLIHLIGEIEVLGVSPKLINRNGGYVVYLKGNDRICDFLGYIGAGNSVMKIIETSAYKDMMNKLVRKQNSELANIRKLSDASAKQILAINKINDRIGLDALPDELRYLAELRLCNPEMSLKELGESLTPKISRSGVNHRIERIFKIAEEL